MALDMKTQMRLTGMASGLDTDAVIQNLGKIHQLRINKVKQDKQMLQWKQDSYRDTISKLNNFAKSNLNIANPLSNMRSSAAFAKFSYLLKGKMGGVDVSELMSVTANGDLKNFSQLVQGVAQLATKDTYVGGKMGLQGIRTNGFDFSNLGVMTRADGQVVINKDARYANFGISIDGTSRTISLSPAEIAVAYGRGGAYGEVIDEKGENGVPGVPNKQNAINDIINAVTGGIDILGRDGNPLFVFNGYDSAGGETYTKIDEAFLENVYKAYDAANGTDAAGSDNLAKIDAINAYFADPNADGSNGGHVIYKELPGNKSKMEAMADLINQKIKEQFGGSSSYANIVTVENNELKFLKSGSTVTLFNPTGFETLQNMGLPSGGASTAGAASNKTVGELAANLFPTNINEVTIKINGTEIKLSKDDTISAAMTKINGSEAGVTLSYSAATDSFTLTSKQEGTANNINFSDDIFAKVFLFGLNILQDNGTPVNHKEAQNFIGVINGEEFTRQSNTFTHEGMTYTFNKTFNVEYEADGTIKRDSSGNIVTGPDDPIKIEVSKNTTDIISTIKNFIDEYNAIVTHINDLLNSKRNRDYPPLTDDEKKAMKDEEIKLYEEKAKSGIMANDTALRKVLSDMRTAIYQKVEGVGITMTDIGITTTANYKDGGLLVIDEEKLKTALDNRYEDVVSLFTKSSSIPASEKDSDKLSKRYSESGIAQRLNDIINSTAGTTVTGDKGYLVKQAGIVNDRTQFDNPMTRQLEEYDKKIDALLERWYRQENNYYAMFARMETAMAKLQAQQNSLAQIMASSSS